MDKLGRYSQKCHQRFKRKTYLSLLKGEFIFTSTPCCEHLFVVKIEGQNQFNGTYTLYGISVIAECGCMF